MRENENVSDTDLMSRGEQLFGSIFGRMELEPIDCPTCQIRFGMKLDDLRFAEQTGEAVWCPRGHKLTATLPKQGERDTLPRSATPGSCSP